MNYKRGRPKQARAGCLLCKPHKFGHGMENDLGHTPYREEVALQSDLMKYLADPSPDFVWAGEEWGYV